MSLKRVMYQLGSKKPSIPNEMIRFQTRISNAAFDDFKQQFRLLNLDITFTKHPLGLTVPSNGVLSCSHEPLDNVVVE